MESISNNFVSDQVGVGSAAAPVAAPGSGATAAPVLGCPSVVVVVLSGGAFAPEAAAAGVGGFATATAALGVVVVLAFFAGFSAAIAQAMQYGDIHTPRSQKQLRMKIFTSTRRRCMVQVWMARWTMRRWHGLGWMGGFGWMLVGWIHVQ